MQREIVNKIIELGNKIHEETKNQKQYFYFDKNTDPRLVMFMMQFKIGDIFEVKN